MPALGDDLGPLGLHGNPQMALSNEMGPDNIN